MSVYICLMRGNITLKPEEGMALPLCTNAISAAKNTWQFMKMDALLKVDV